ncbi:MAG: DUF721 domain-containing protein [Planctomycetota bacterium]
MPRKFIVENKKYVTAADMNAKRAKNAKRATPSKLSKPSKQSKPIDSNEPNEPNQTNEPNQPLISKPPKPSKKPSKSSNRAGWGKQARELYEADEELQVVQRHYEEQSWRPSDAKPFRSLIANLLVTRGYARQREATAVADAWVAVAGPKAAARSRAGKVFKGVLSVFVEDATLIQELTFRKRQLVEELAKRLPDHRIREVRFKANSQRSGS